MQWSAFPSFYKTIIVVLTKMYRENTGRVKCRFHTETRDKATYSMVSSAASDPVNLLQLIWLYQLRPP